MKALTICQPYADMIAKSEKTVENRTWPTSYRGLIAIHAGKSRDWLDPDDEDVRPDMAFGAVVALARLVDCLPVDQVPPEVAEVNIGHVNGPWCWILKEVMPFETPKPARGAQGLWEWIQ